MKNRLPAIHRTILSARFFVLQVIMFLVVKAAFAQAPGGVSTNLNLWLKANAGVSSSGGKVTTWADQGSNGYNATQAVVAKQPLFTPSSSFFNSNPSVDFDLVDDAMGTYDQIASEPYSFFAVFNSTSNTATPRRAIQGSNNWLMGPYNGDAGFYAGAWVELNNIPVTSTPYISSGTSTTAATNNARFYYNGRNTAPAGVTATAAPGFVYLGAAGLSTNEPMGGSIAEVIAYNSVPTAVERNKIESYLAIKYGITLNQATGAANEYINSAGVNVWDTAANGVYKNNIFGIGVDNGSGLSQTRSASVNTNTISIANPSVLADGDFLLLSDNGLSAGPTLQGGLPGGATHASQRIWNTSKTGNAGLVDITINSIFPSVKLLIDNNNDGTYETVLTPTSISGNDYSFAGVSLSNLSKLRLAYTIPVSAPGGLSTNLKLWLKGSLASAIGGNVTNWTDNSGAGNDANTLTGTGPLLTPGAINGNPSVTMSGAGGIIGSIVPTMTSNRSSAFIVTKAGTAVNRGVFSVGNGGTDISGNVNAVMFIASNGVTNVGTYRNAAIRGRYINADAVTNYHLYTSLFNASSNLFYNEGKPATTAAFAQQNYSISKFSLGGWLTSGVLGNFSNGEIAELIMYDRDVTTTEQQNIQSYLAIKYGITIDQTTATNYTNAAGTVVWDATLNATYKNNIFGIGQDDADGLLQSQSVSLNTNRVRISNPSSLVTGSFFLVGDNNLSITPAAQGGLPGGATLATPLTWGVSKIGTPGTVDLAIISPNPFAILLVDNDNNGSFETAIPATSSAAGPGSGYTHNYAGVNLNHLAKFKLGYKCSPSGSPSTSITIAIIAAPTLNACSGQGNFVVRLSNLSASDIPNVIFKDSMPPGINYVPGTVSGTGVTFGSNLSGGNVVSFNVANIPSSGFVDIGFSAAADCGVSRLPADIANVYNVQWDCGYLAPFQTPTYGVNFPSLSVSPDNSAPTAFCLTPFVRRITICNGGFGPVDSLSFSESENNSSMIVLGFDKGTVTGAGTTKAKTVLHAADFIAAGFAYGQLRQNDCIVIYDTVRIVGSTSPIKDTLRADWGCSATICNNGTTNNEVIINTAISGASVAPVLTRTLTVIGPADSAGQIYNRPVTYREVVKNNSTVVAVNAKIYPAVLGLKYIDIDSIWASKNGAARYHPPYFVNTGQGFQFNGSPATNMGTVLEPITYTGQSLPNNTQLTLGDLLPGDSVVVTFVVRTAGPVTRVSDGSFNHCSTEGYCGSCYRYNDGPSIGGAVDANMSWEGCPAGAYNICDARFPQFVYNGRDAAPVTEYDASSGYAHFIARFRGAFGWVDSTATNKCAYFDGDTLRILMSAAVLDLPFYTNKSKFCIKLKTNGGVKWDGRLNRTFGRLTSWSQNPWLADRVVDSTAQDSTIRVYFRRSNMPAQAATALAANVYNSYQGGGWNLAIGLVNTCPGPAQKRILMTRVYTIDTTNSEPAIESGPTIFPSNYTWNSICVGPCSDGVSIANYAHTRTTFGQPDNDGNGLPDASGVLDMNVVNTNLITWGDTLQTKYKFIIHTTQAGGVPFMYVNSSINYSPISVAIAMNTALLKTIPQVTLKRPGVGTFTSTGGDIPVSTSNYYITNLSLTGAGNIGIPGINAYQEGDTLEVVENIVFWKVGAGIGGPTTFSFLHVPYTALVTNPTPPQQFKCDSVVCNFQGIDMDVQRQVTNMGAASCSDTTVVRYIQYDQTANAVCGSTYFPGESRTVLTPTFLKLVIPAGSPWSITSIYATNRSNIESCSYPFQDKLVPASQYYYSGDTLMMDNKKIVQFLGGDLLTNNLFSQVWYYFHFRYTPPVTDSGCVKDHINPQTLFTTPLRYETSRPVDSTNIRNIISNTGQVGVGGNGSGVFLSWPGANNNNVAMYAGTSATVSNPNVVVPVRYTRGSSGVYGFDFLAIPNRPGIIVDSVKDKLTGAKAVTVAGSAIYQVAGFMGGANSTRDFDVYTHVNLCDNDVLTVYADRTPCGGYPASWSAYGCKSNARSATYTYITFKGELQMTDSLHAISKELCTADTVQFKVINSQTQDAFAVKVSFDLPQFMTLLPGRTQAKIGNGAWATVSDPILSGSTYSWILPAADTLRNVSLSPLNTLYLRVGVSTGCGYKSGAQITSQVNGFVACGAITSLTNTNPPPLTIIGAPAITYFTNLTGDADQISGLNNPLGYDYRVSMRLSGSPTGNNDSVSVLLPAKYVYVSYNPVSAGAKNAPAGQPNITLLPNGDRLIGWLINPGVVPPDSIKFTFKYNQLNNENKCGISPANNSVINTSVTGTVFCATTGQTCGIGLITGTDTVALQSIKPSLQVALSSSFAYHCATPPQCGKDYVDMTGTIFNSGMAPVPPGSPILMEVFVDLDNSGTVTAGDKVLTTYQTTAGLPAGSSMPFTYNDSFPSCSACVGKSLMIRFDQYPGGSSVQQQSLCDSSLTQSLGVPISILDDFGNLPTGSWIPVSASMAAVDSAWLGMVPPTTEPATLTNDPSDGLFITESGAPTNGTGSSLNPIALVVSSPSDDFEFNITVNGSGAAKQVYYGVWFDANNNGSFNDAQDVFVKGNTMHGSPVTVSIPFTLFTIGTNLGASLGKVRVVGVSGPDPLFTKNIFATRTRFVNGEVEDYYITYPTILPIELLNFSAEKAGGASILSWKVANTANTSNFILERSSDGRNWNALGTIPVTSSLIYGFTDQYPISGANYYRLMQKDKDGRIQYSAIRIVNFGNKPVIGVFPNPAKTWFTITGLAVTDKAELLDVIGTRVRIISTGSSAQKVEISNLANGTYLLRVKSASGDLTTIKLIKN
ncbi:MAG: T9SS type A sorting domain-containing protein [Bacteroidota bacterium]